MATLRLTLEGGATAPAVRVPANVSAGDLANLPQALDVSRRNGSIALVGGAKTFDAPENSGLRIRIGGLLTELASLAATKRLAVITGGTSSGVMRMMGHARADREARFPLIGVAPLGKVTWVDRPEGEGGTTMLEPNHSAFVLVEGDTWGVESTTLASVAHVLADGRPTIEVLIDGGDISRIDIRAFVDHGGTVLTVAGSGRFADALAVTSPSDRSADPAIQAVLASGRVHVFQLGNDSASLTDTVQELTGW